MKNLILSSIFLFSFHLTTAQLKFEIYKSLSGNPIATHRDRNEFDRLLNYSSTLNPVFKHLSPQKVDNERINKILEVFPNEIQSSLTDDKLNEQTEP